jgi:hypothetical protein
MGLSEPELRQRVEERVRDGRLPRQLPVRRWAGYSRLPERTCSGCGEIITASTVEVEIDAPGFAGLVFHLHCEAVWEAVVRQPPA